MNWSKHLMLLFFLLILSVPLVLATPNLDLLDTLVLYFKIIPLFIVSFWAWMAYDYIFHEKKKKLLWTFLLIIPIISILSMTLSKLYYYFWVIVLPVSVITFIISLSYFLAVKRKRK